VIKSLLQEYIYFPFDSISWRKWHHVSSLFCF